VTKCLEEDFAFRDVSDASHYNPQSETVHSDKLMTGPVFPSVEAANKYFPHEPKVENDPVMSAPKYPRVDSANMYAPPGQMAPR